MKIVRPNNRMQYQALNSVAAIEPPIWQAMLANKYGADGVVDLELDSSFQTSLQEPLIYLPTGSHPSAFIQAREGIQKTDKDIVLMCLPENIIDHKPRWELIDISKYRSHNWHSWTNNFETSPYGVTFTSISCPYNCSYCTVKHFYNSPYTLRRLDYFENDLSFFRSNGVKNLKLLDEIFTIHPRRVEEVCDILKKFDFNVWVYGRIDSEDMPLKKMKESGINWIAYGIDDFKGGVTMQKIMDVVKTTQDEGIAVLGNFLFGFWDDDLDSLKKRLDFAKELNCDYVNFYCLSAFPDTDLYELMKEKGVSLPDSWNQYAQMSPEFKALPTAYLTGKQVLEFRDVAFKDYYSNTDYLNSIKAKFGDKAVENVNYILSLPLKRND